MELGAFGAERGRPQAQASGPWLEVQRFDPGPLTLVGIAVAIFFCGYLTLFLPREPDQFTPVGLVDSVLFSVLVLVRMSRWPWVILAATAGELAVGVVMRAPLGLALAMTSCSVLICTVCSLSVLRVLGRAPDMARVSSIAAYLGIVAATAIGGALLASAVRSAITDAPLMPNILVWASRDFTGLATLAPCLIVLMVRPLDLRGLVGLQAWPFALLLVVEAATFFTDRMPLTYVLIAALLLVTWRLRIVGAVVGILTTFAFAVPATLWGYGPFAAFEVSAAEQLLTMQLFLTVTFHMTVPVAIQLARARRLQQALGDALTSVHESEARYRLIADNMRDIVVQTDIEGRLVYVSPSCRLLGYAPEEMLGRSGAEFTHPDDIARLLANRSQILKGVPDNAADRRHRVRLKDGTFRWFEGSPSRLADETGQPIGIINVFRDIHEQRTADAALSASDARYRLLADNMNDIVACYDRDGVFTFATGATELVLGYKAHELVGRAIGTMIHPDDRQSSRERFERHREAGPGAPAFRVEYRFVRRDGSPVWLQANPRAVFDADGEFVEWQDVVRDVTESKALEKELRRAQAVADAAARSKADFLADMGHEVRGPLNSVIGFARIARTQKDRVEWCMDCIEEAARSLLTMVGDVLDFSRIEAAQVHFRAEPLKLSEFLRATLAQLEPQARAKSLKVGLVDRTHGALVIATDANRLRQVLINLLGNAVKFTHAGEVTLEATHEAERLLVRVRDTGPGVPKDQLGDLFERFSPAHPSSGHAPGGVGLGLAISKGIVEGLGGQIEVESEPGRGTCFSFWIPAPSVESDADHEGDAQPALPPLRILVATMEPSLQALVERALAHRAEVLPADDLAAANRIAAQEPLDLIIVDLVLARGAPTLRRLRKASGPNSHTPALAFSSETSDELYARALGDGFQGLVAKSSSPAELVSGVAEALLSAEPWGRPEARPGVSKLNRWRRDRLRSGSRTREPS